MKNKPVLLALLRVFGALPLAVGRGLGSGLGRLSWALQDRGSRTTLCNLRLCFPEKTEAELRTLACNSMRETGKLGVEISQIWHKDKAWLDAKIVKVTGQSILDDAIARGKGVLVIAPHLGNWEILGMWLLPFGKRCTYLYQPPKQPFLEPLMKSARERFGASIVPTNRRGILELLKRLKNGELTGILPDQVPEPGSGEFSPFFGLPAYTITLVHGLVQRTGCAVVFGVAERAPGGFHIHLTLPPEDIYSSDMSASLEALNQGVESCVRQCPEQYQWEYKRFKAGIDGRDPYNP